MVTKLNEDALDDYYDRVEDRDNAQMKLNEAGYDNIKIFDLKHTSRRDPFVGFGINWSARGTEPVEDTRDFIKGLSMACDLVDELNKKWVGK